MKPEQGDQGWYSPVPRVLLPSDEAHVWRIFLDDAATLAFCQERWLAPEQKRRADSFRFPRDRQRFVIRRGIARVIKGRLTARYLLRPSATSPAAV